MTPGDELDDKLRSLPAVDRVVAALGTNGPPQRVVAAARRAVDRARSAIRSGADAPTFDAIVADARGSLAAERRRLLQPVINATGVLVHTNLGRTPLGDEQIAAVSRVAQGYSNLEYDVVSGSRGDRYSHARALLTALTGAESALVVNNNAAAVLLVLAGLCRGREVIVSRGELIEIGGEFRVPDVMAASGARLVEVGTTNRTHLADYERAIGTETAAIMKIHPSNYRVVGFTASVPPRHLGRLARDKDVLFLHDVGSGLVGTAGEPELTGDEPAVDVALEDGADLVTFSGDKLLGGPQAGIIVGRADLVERLARDPLLRALRVDKLTLAALEATLSLYLDDRHGDIPLWQMASVPLDDLERRARSLASAVRATDVKAEAVPTRAVAGGGSLPGRELSSWAVSIVHASRTPDELARSFRAGDPPVVGRIEGDRLLLDLRTVPETADATLERIARVALHE